MRRQPSQTDYPRVTTAEDAAARRARTVADALARVGNAPEPKLAPSQIRARASELKTRFYCPIQRQANPPRDTFAHTSFERKGTDEPITPDQSVHTTPTHMPVLKTETLFFGRSHADIDRCCAELSIKRPSQPQSGGNRGGAAGSSGSLESEHPKRGFARGGDYGRVRGGCGRRCDSTTAHA